MTDLPIETQAAQAVGMAPNGQAARPGTELAPLTPAELREILGTRVIPIREWVQALNDVAEFQESDQEDKSLSVVKAIMLATTSEEIFAAMDMRTAKELTGDQPGGRSNVLEIFGAWPMKSTFEDGASCFAVISAHDLATDERFTFSCGARAVQTAVMMHMVIGACPFKAVVTKRSRPTEAGFYPLNLERGI
jgi:hypothetical protein